jgi:alpha-tubulin suppressor-like RCC1 family protein
MNEHLPTHEQQCYLVDIICGKRISALLASNGLLWICGNYKQEKLTPKTSVEDEEIARHL